jgi:hypothetical protein
MWDLPAGEGRVRQPSGVVGALVNDWSVATFMTLQSGAPVAVTQANSLGYAGFTTQRPNVIADPALRAGERTPDRWFNTAAFATANQFTIGSASRNPVRGPSYHDVDLAAIRRVGFEGERAIEFRLEVFNLLNTTNFGAPAAQLGPASFGTITTALDPRVVQMAAKFWF